MMSQKLWDFLCSQQFVEDVGNLINVINCGRSGADGRPLNNEELEKRWTKSSVLFCETCFLKPTTGTEADRPGGGEMRMERGHLREATQKKKRVPR